MKIITSLVPALLLCCSLGLYSCKKSAGEGGSAIVKGKAFNMLYDPNGKFLEREEAREENIYIIYGNDEIYDDHMKTHSDGGYEFKFLRKGSYTLFGYSDCNSCPSNKNPVSLQVNIADKKETLTAHDLELKKTIKINGGSSSLQGRVYVMEYNSVNQLLWQYYAPKEKVYVVYDTDSVYFKNIDTNADGTYEFGNLINGTYKVYAYSDCLSCPQGKVPVVLQANITAKGQMVILPNLVIEKRP